MVSFYCSFFVYTVDSLSLSLEFARDQRICSRERIRDRERKIGWNQWKGTEKIVRDREKFEIEVVRVRESPL